MIPYLLCMAFLGFSAWVTAQFPAATVPSEVMSSLTAVAGAAGQLNDVFPVAELFAAFGLYLSLWSAVVGLRVMIYVYKLIPFV